ncbi:MAG TPA: hypothetical protein VIY28_06435 [Pseudonocardiaceae bacterium]
MVVVRLVFGAPAMVRWPPGLAGGALVGFGLSRAVGVFGFVEGGFQPAQALLSVLTEGAMLALLAVPIVERARAHQAA